MFGSKRAAFTRTLRRGATGEDVRHLQELLKIAGHDPGPVDGVFGSATHTAVVAFQRSKGLEADGAVGPITRAALAQAVLEAETPAGSSRTGLSLHIGLNNVDNSAYGFNVPPLAGCINDANDMQAIARSKGFRTRQLLDGAATAAAVTGAIREAARTLASGDIFWITYSGHGSQVPDPAEPDQRSETWVLYDRQLLDDELYALWSSFVSGVRVIVISDSCHSGTVTRELRRLQTELSRATQQTNDGAAGGVLTTPLAVRLTLDLVGATSTMLQAAGHTRAEAAPAVVGRALGPVVSTQTASRAVVASEQPRLFDRQQASYDTARRVGLYREAVATARSAPPPQCSVMLLASAQDNQTASDGRPDPSGHQNGAYTKLLREQWPSATDYADLHGRILAQMPSTQTPNLFWATQRDVAFEAQRPFTI